MTNPTPEIRAPAHGAHGAVVAPLSHGYAVNPSAKSEGGRYLGVGSPSTRCRDSPAATRFA